MCEYLTKLLYEGQNVAIWSIQSDIFQSLSSICNIYKESPVIAQSVLQQSEKCNCDDYKKDIENLKTEIEIQKKRCDDVELLRDELKTVVKLIKTVLRNNWK